MHGGREAALVGLESGDAVVEQSTGRHRQALSFRHADAFGGDGGLVIAGLVAHDLQDLTALEEYRVAQVGAAGSEGALAHVFQFPGAGRDVGVELVEVLGISQGGAADVIAVDTPEPVVVDEGMGERRHVPGYGERAALGIVEVFGESYFLVRVARSGEQSRGDRGVALLQGGAVPYQGIPGGEGRHAEAVELVPCRIHEPVGGALGGCVLRSADVDLTVCVHGSAHVQGQAEGIDAQGVPVLGYLTDDQVTVRPVHGGVVCMYGAAGDVDRVAHVEQRAEVYAGIVDAVALCRFSGVVVVLKGEAGDVPGGRFQGTEGGLRPVRIEVVILLVRKYQNAPAHDHQLFWAISQAGRTGYLGAVIVEVGAVYIYRRVVVYQQTVGLGQLGILVSHRPGGQMREGPAG